MRIVLLHGLLTDHRLWRKVMPLLEGIETFAPTLPLGSHTTPAAPGTDLSPPGLAPRSSADMLEGDVATRRQRHRRRDRPARRGQPPRAHRRARAHQLRRLRALLPAAVPPAPARGRIPGGVEAIVATLQIPAARRLPIAYGKLTKRPIERAVTDAWAAPSRHSAAIRRDLRAVLRGVDSRHLLDAVPRLRTFDKPVTLAWAREDRLVFPPSIAERLAGDFPRARIEWIEDSLTFVPEDRPHELAAILRAAAGNSAQ